VRLLYGGKYLNNEDKVESLFNFNMGEDFVPTVHMMLRNLELLQVISPGIHVLHVM